MYIETWIPIFLFAIICFLAYKLYEVKNRLSILGLAARGEVIRLSRISEMYLKTMEELEKHISEDVYSDHGLMNPKEAVSFCHTYGNTEKNTYLSSLFLSDRKRQHIELASNQLYK